MPRGCGVFRVHRLPSQTSVRARAPSSLGSNGRGFQLTSVEVHQSCWAQGGVRRLQKVQRVILGNSSMTSSNAADQMTQLMVFI
jgi:hypothetical protein